MTDEEKERLELKIEDLRLLSQRVHEQYERQQETIRRLDEQIRRLAALANLDDIDELLAMRARDRMRELVVRLRATHVEQLECAATIIELFEKRSRL